MCLGSAVAVQTSVENYGGMLLFLKIFLYIAVSNKNNP